ncbi:MAG: hypothetical protein KF773_32645 [Deltaproteobacteria bacterium]|nr:hypothetical protein [Deltaproteobacteria bacterium]
MHQRSLKLLLVAALATVPACYATGGYGYTGYYATPTVEAQVAAPVAQVDVAPAAVGVQIQAPQLVTVDASPSVQVFADYDEPIFYTDNTYWRYTNNNWYRSSTYTGGWTYEASVPYAVRSIDRPDRYRNYRPAGYTPRHNPTYANRGYQQPARGGYQQGGYNNTYVPPARGYGSGWQQPSHGGYQQPARGGGYTPPARTGYQQPSHGGGYTPPARTGYQQPSHGGGYTPPARTGYQQPARTGYQQPARTGYQQPASRPAVRDHRAPTPTYAPSRAPARDHRQGTSSPTYRAPKKR